MTEKKECDKCGDWKEIKREEYRSIFDSFVENAPQKKEEKQWSSINVVFNGKKETAHVCPKCVEQLDRAVCAWLGWIEVTIK